MATLLFVLFHVSFSLLQMIVNKSCQEHYDGELSNVWPVCEKSHALMAFLRNRELQRMFVLETFQISSVI